MSQSICCTSCQRKLDFTFNLPKSIHHMEYIYCSSIICHYYDMILRRFCQHQEEPSPSSITITKSNESILPQFFHHQELSSTILHPLLLLHPLDYSGEPAIFKKPSQINFFWNVSLSSMFLSAAGYYHLLKKSSTFLVWNDNMKRLTLV